MILPMIADWFIGAISTLFISVFDYVCYGLLIVSYNIFYAISQIDLFGGGSAGQTLYTEITSRLYMILSIVMVFVFAYQLIMLIIDPDGKGKGASSQIVKDTLISIVMLIAFPLVFRYMAMFQFHVLENNTIPAIILGTNGGASNENPGKSVAQMVLISFYQPNGTTYTTFYDENGHLRSDAVDQCNNDTAAEDGESHPETCEKYVEALTSWDNKDGISGLSSITGTFKLRSWIFDTMTYWFVISSVAALAIAWVFSLYSIDIGVRAVKLGVLQLISPIPVILKIFPNTKKTFDTWFSEIKKTYLELFIRVAVIFFALELIKLIPVFWDIIWESQGSSNAGFKTTATVILIFGILKFAQDAPALFKELFSVGGNLLSGVKLDPTLKGAKSRITDNKAAMWGIGKIASGIGGGIGEYRRQYQSNINARRNAADEGYAESFFKALPSMWRGVVSGVKQKNTTPSDLSRKDLRQTVVQGAEAGHENFNSNQKLQDKATVLERKLTSKRLSETSEERWTEEERKFMETYQGAGFDKINLKEARHQAKIDDRTDRKKAFDSAISYDSSNSLATSLSAIVKGLENMKSQVNTKKIDKEIEELQRLVNSSTVRDEPHFDMQMPTNTGNQAQYEEDMKIYESARATYQKRMEEYRKYKDAESLLKDKKAEKNKKISDTLNATDVSRQFATTSINNVIAEIKKSPSPEAKQYITQLTDISARANTGTLTKEDTKAINDIIDNLSNVKTFSNAFVDLQKSSAPQTSGDSGSKGSSGSSGDKK